MDQKPKIAIVYLLFYHNESYVDDMVSALKKITYPKDRLELVIVSNPHPTDGSFLHYIEEAVMPFSGTELPHVTVLPQTTNTGFAGGNNAGTTWALENGFDFVYYHNNDGFFATNAFEPLVNAFADDKRIGMAQSLLLLHPETDLVNSTGNMFQYMGFGYCDDYRTPIKTLDLPPVKDISYASGAGLMVRTDLIREYGMWDEDFFLYHEDLEWCFRLRVAGYRTVLVRDSIFYHKYQFGRSIEKFYWMERNRYGVMLMFFSWPTLVMLLPMALVLELGLWFFAFINGWFEKRVEVYKYWLNIDHWKLWLKKRRYIQSIRKVTDRYLLSFSGPGIYFQDEKMRNPILIYFGNPLMKLYHWVVVKGLIWW